LFKMAFGLNQRIRFCLMSGFVCLTMPLVAPYVAIAQNHSHGNQQAPAVSKNQALVQKSLEILEAAQKGQYEKVRAAAAPQLAADLTTDDIKAIWENLIETTGPVEKVLSTRSANTINAYLVFVKTQFQKESGEFIFTFNNRGEILGIDFPTIGSLDEISKIVVEALADGNFAKARGYLHSSLKTEIFPQQVQEKWQQLLKSTGDFKRIKSITVRRGSAVDNTDVVLVDVEFAKVSEDIFVIFDNNRRVVGIDVPEESR
jgi:hypothetical protein